MLSKPAQVGDIFSAWAARSLIPSSSVTCDKKNARTSQENWKSVAPLKRKPGELILVGGFNPSETY